MPGMTDRDLPIDNAHALALAVKRDEDAAAATRTPSRVVAEEFRWLIAPILREIRKRV